MRRILLLLFSFCGFVSFTDSVSTLNDYKSLLIGSFKWSQSHNESTIYTLKKDKTFISETIRPGYYQKAEGKYSLSMDRGKVKWKINWKTGYYIQDSIRTDYNKDSFTLWYKEFWGELKNDNQWLYIGHASGKTIKLLGPYIKQEK
ncbi:MAG: hypothetical protein LBT48_00315 [Prevotellaceae bacterium]|jgi:hypothetical protein|nr:hypothetical protein [Prevotellaceae bacterium]